MKPRPPTSTLFPYTTLFRSIFGCLRTTPSRRPFRDAQASRLASDSPCSSNPTGTARAWRVRCKARSEEHTSELQSLTNLVCRLLLEKKKKKQQKKRII